MTEIMEYNRRNVLSTYDAIGDQLEKRNDENIEKYRKGKMTFHFAPGQHKIVLKQKSHAFRFGSTGFMLGSFECDEKEVTFREKFTRIFNQAVVPFYWKNLEPEEGRLRFTEDSPKLYRRPAPDVVLRFCREYGIEPKGHCLAWHAALPDWLEKYTPDERKVILERRFREISERYADIIPSFDVVNESASHYPIGVKKLFENYDEYALELGQKYFPNNRKIINETNEGIWYSYNCAGKYMPFNMQLRDFARRGLPFDEIGIQYHIFAREEELKKGPSTHIENHFNAFLNAEEMLGVLDLMDSFDRPMHISEITIPSYWGGDAVKEDAQAALTDILYRTWFATPNMKSIVWWNLVDGYAAGAPQGTGEGENRYGGGLLRYDMSEKPAYRVIDELINKTWRTGYDGICGEELSLRGFYGDYEITVEDETGKRTSEFSFKKDGEEIII